MAYYGSIQVQDRSGWVKTFRLEKALVMVGSAAVNDIVLPVERGEDVFPVHLQLLHPQPELMQVRAVNLANSAIPMQRANTAGAGSISANASQDLQHGDALQVGQFTLTLSIQSGEGFSRAARSEHLGLKLELPTATLRAAKQLDGLLTVTNFGAQKRGQFEIDLEGLPLDCYQIDPAPLLYPNGEEQLRIRLFHRGTRPLAGARPICLRMTASAAYPTEEVVLPVNLEVAAINLLDVCILESQEPPVEWAAAAPISAPVPVPAPEMAVSLAQPAPEASHGPSQVTAPRGAVESGPALSDPRVSGDLAPKEQPAGPGPAPEAEEDWWSETTPTPAAAQPFGPSARRGGSRKPRLTPNGNIQVLRTPQAPAGSDADLPIPLPESNGVPE
jgi:hypothetical protein